MGKQFLVERASNLGQENRVIVVLKELRSSREPGMHGVPGFVGQGINVGKYIPLVVHQNVRWRVVAAGGKRATAFPPRFVTIAPAAAQTVGECAAVFLAHGGQGSDDFVDCLIKADLW